MKHLRKLLAAVLCLAVAAVSADAATRYWVGSGGNWSDNANWASFSGGGGGATAPGVSDDVIFDGAGTGNSVVDASASATVNSVTVSGGYTGTITQNRDLGTTSDFLMAAGTWQFTAGTPADLSVGGNMSLTDSTIYCQYSSISGNGTGRTFNVTGDLTVGTGVTIDGIGLGFNTSQGPGKPVGASGGSGHGGEGGFWNHYQAGGPGGPCYGSVTNPSSLGSGGYREKGGGAVRLDVGGTVTVDGTINMDGNSSSTGDRGGGAGGAIYINATSVLGSGTLRAKGSKTLNANAFAPGGGGRVAIHYATTLGLPLANISVASVDAHYYGQDGAAGTLYVKKGSDALGTLFVDNDNVPTAAGGGWPKPTTTINSDVTDVPAGNVLIRDLGDLQVESGQTLVVQGYWTNSAAFTADAGSTFELAGTGTSTLDGSTTFYNLTCTNAGKRLLFAAGDTFTVQNLLHLEGTAGSLVELDSTATPTRWNLVVPLLAHTLEYLDVQDSDASGGSSAETFNSTNSGNNVNWIFAERNKTNTWIGVTSTAWSTDSNWDLGRPPISADHVVISNPASFYPLLDSAKILSRLTIKSGASLSLSGYDLTVESNAVIAGTLTATGTETIEFLGALDGTGGALNNADSTVRLVGTSPQTITCGGLDFEDLIVQNAVGVTFTDAVRATNLTNNGSAIAFGGSVSVAGTLDTSSADIHVAGAVTAGTLNHQSGDLVFGAPVTVTTFESDMGDLTFSNDVTAVNFSSTAGGDTITAGASANFSVTNLSLFGSSGNQLTLRSTTGGSQW